jgi:hypothetical protein
MTLLIKSKPDKNYPFSIFDLGVFAHILGHRNPDGTFTGSEENLAAMYPSDNKSEEARRKAVNRSISRWLNLECLEEDVPSRPKTGKLGKGGTLPKIVHPTCTLIELLANPRLWTASNASGKALSNASSEAVSNASRRATPDDSDTKHLSDSRGCPVPEGAPLSNAEVRTPFTSQLTINGGEVACPLGSELKANGSRGDVQCPPPHEPPQPELHEQLRLMRETLAQEEATRATMAHPDSTYWQNKIRDLRDEVYRLEAETRTRQGGLNGTVNG